jgi:hypothetical protein
MTSHQLDGQTEIKMAGDTSSTTSQLDGLQKHEQIVLETEKEDDLEAELHISTWLVVFVSRECILTISMASMRGRARLSDLLHTGYQPPGNGIIGRNCRSRRMYMNFSKGAHQIVN